MGILNITADSFSDGGLYLDPQQAIAHGLELLDEGADILDLGAESTRPGSHAGDPADAAVSAEQEQARILPVLEGILKARPDTILSIDTYKSSTALAGVKAGAEIINDVSGLLWDEQMAAACAELRCGVVLMHTRGKPEEWRTLPPLSDDEVLPLVRDGLATSLAVARSAGIADNAIVLDPGYGFGKRLDENYALLARQAQLLSLGRPLLAGLSRKSFLARTLAKLPIHPNQELSIAARDNAGIAALTAAILNGASILRVHSVRPALEAAAVAAEILAHSPFTHEPR
jgi:dihydropteroate synthase